MDSDHQSQSIPIVEHIRNTRQRLKLARTYSDIGKISYDIAKEIIGKINIPGFGTEELQQTYHALAINNGANGAGYWLSKILEGTGPLQEFATAYQMNGAELVEFFSHQYSLNAFCVMGNLTSLKQLVPSFTKEDLSTVMNAGNAPHFFLYCGELPYFSPDLLSRDSLLNLATDTQFHQERTHDLQHIKSGIPSSQDWLARYLAQMAVPASEKREV